MAGGGYVRGRAYVKVGETHPVDGGVAADEGYGAHVAHDAVVFNGQVLTLVLDFRPALRMHSRGIPSCRRSLLMQLPLHVVLSLLATLAW